MKKFRFRLERVLNHRERLEKEKQMALGKVHQVVAEQKERLLEASTILDRARDDLRRAEGGGEIDVEDVRNQRVYVGSLKRRVSAVMKSLRELETELTRRRDEAVEARKERKTLEMLRARRHAEYVARADRVEQAELDDLASRREGARRSAMEEVA